MARKTKAQKKAEIKPWRAKWTGTCPKCQGRIEKDVLVCRNQYWEVIHFVCHPDWFPAPLGVKEG